MLIGYDGRFITRQPTGNGVYATRLVEALSRIDDRNFYRLYMAGPEPAVPADLKNNVEVRVMHPWHRSAWIRVPILFPWELYCRPVNIFHAHYTVPPRIKARVVLTLHDFFWVIYPEQFVSIKRIPITYTIRHAVARADCILVGTSFIKHETMTHFGVPEERFAMIPYGLDPRFFETASPDQLAAVRRRYGIDGPYILAVGDLHPRKNLHRLLQAYAQIAPRYDVKLVLVGKPLWKVQGLWNFVKQARLEDRVIATGYVPDADMPLLYQSAEIFCYPSLYEGFGFPIIEAMASGTPVALSNASSCPEVGGDAAAYFDPCSIEDIAARLAQLLDDTVLQRRCRTAGRLWARRFTWEHTARQTLAVYNSLS